MTDEPAKPAATPLPPPAAVVVALSARGKKMLARAGWASSPDVCDFVMRAAAVKKSQKTIAAMLGKPLRTFEDSLSANKGDNPLRLAYEAGAAKWEQDKIDIWNTLDPRDPKQMIGAMFAMKALAGWRDKPDAATTDGGRITIMLPGSLPQDEYYAKLGITGPLDTRDPSKRGAALGGVKVGDMTDVTPGADGMMPVLGAGKVATP